MADNVKSNFDRYNIGWSLIPDDPSRKKAYEERDKKDLDDYIQKIIKFIEDNEDILVLYDYQEINKKIETVMNVKDISSKNKLADLKKSCKPYLYKIIAKFTQLEEELKKEDPENKKIKHLSDLIFSLYKIVY